MAPRFNSYLPRLPRRALDYAGALTLAAVIVLAPGLADAKVIKGSKKDDRIVGTSRADRISGQAGDDRLSGKGGKDKIRGGSGNDRLVGGPATDTLAGSAGNDKLKSVDGTPDKALDAGDGDDICIADFVDSAAIAACETVRLKGDGGGGDGGGPGGDGGGPGGGGGTGTPPGALTITDAEVECSPAGGPGSGCQFTVNGDGADVPNGTVTVKSGSETIGGGPAGADPQTGDYQGAGSYVCQGQVSSATLTVAFASESASVSVPCSSSGGGTPTPPGDDNLTLTVTETSCSADPSPQNLGYGCTYKASGTGADLPSGSATVMQGPAVVGGGAVNADPETRAYTVDGAYGCQGGNPPTEVKLTVRIGGEAAEASLPCAA